MLTLGGCGGGDEETRPADGAGIEIHGGTARDQKIADDLRAYMGNCGVLDIPSFAAYRREFAEPHPESELSPREVRRYRRYFIQRYGSLRNAYLMQTATCRPTSISVSNGVITVNTRLEDDRLGRLTARDTCSLIQASDVADFTEGHRVLAADGTVLARCPARAG